MKQRLIYPLAAFIILVAIWEISSRHFAENLFILPAPSAIVERIVEKSDRFLFHTLITLSEMLVGAGLAILASFPLALGMYRWQSARLVLQPLFVFIQCMPMFALAPIMVMWFGWGYTAIVVPTALMIFFPLTINIYQGLKSTPNSYIEYFKINQATSFQIFLKLQLPWAVPHLFSGLRVAAAVAGIGAVAGEWSGAQSGLGILMLESRRATDLETTFGALFCLAFISLALYSIILLMENITLKVKPMPTKALVALLAFLGMMLGGCQQSETSGETRLLLDWLPNPNHVPLYVGVEKGFFEQYGINLSIQKVSDPADAIPYVTSGKAELALFYMPDTIRAIERGANIKPIGILFKQPLNAVIFRKTEKIKKPADLNGKVVGYCVDGTGTVVLDYILEKNQIEPLEKRNVSFDLVSTLGTNKVDAIYGAYWNIECEHLESLGIQTDHFDLRDLSYPNYYELIVVAQNNSNQTDPGFVEAFQRALQASIDYSVQNPDEAFDIYLKANPDKGAKTSAWEKQSWNKTYPILTLDQHFDNEVWQKLRAWVRSHQLK